MFKSVILLLAVLALASAFAPFAKFGRQSVRLNSCEDRVKDAKGRCPGATGFSPTVREAPTDFAAYQAAQKAKATAAKETGRCAEKLVDAKGRCPGDTGYIPLIKEAPTDFAAYQAAQKAKKAAEGK